MKKPLQVGDRVRLKGYANRVKNGWAIAVDGLRGKIVSRAGGHMWNVMVSGIDGELEIFESQLIPARARRVWDGHWMNAGPDYGVGFFPKLLSSELEEFGRTRKDMVVREVKRKGGGG